MNNSSVSETFYRFKNHFVCHRQEIYSYKYTIWICVRIQVLLCLLSTVGRAKSAYALYIKILIFEHLLSTVSTHCEYNADNTFPLSVQSEKYTDTDGTRAWPMWCSFTSRWHCCTNLQPSVAFHWNGWQAQCKNNNRNKAGPIWYYTFLPKMPVWSCVSV